MSDVSREDLELAKTISKAILFGGRLGKGETAIGRMSKVILPYIATLRKRAESAEAKIKELEAKVKKYEEALLDIKHHTVEPFTDHKFLNYCNDVAEKALEEKGGE